MVVPLKVIERVTKCLHLVCLHVQHESARGRPVVIVMTVLDPDNRIFGMVVGGVAYEIGVPEEVLVLQVPQSHGEVSRVQTDPDIFSCKIVV